MNPLEFIKAPSEVNLIGVNGGKVECHIFGVPKPKVTAVEETPPEEAEEIETNNGVLTILAGVGLAAAIVVLVTQLMVASVWINAEDNENAGQWSQVLPF